MSTHKAEAFTLKHDIIIRHLEQRIRTLEQASNDRYKINQSREAFTDSLERQVWLLEQELQVERKTKQPHSPDEEYIEKLLAHIGWLESQRERLSEKLKAIEQMHDNLQPMWRLLESVLVVVAPKLDHQLPGTVIKGLQNMPAEHWQGRDIALVVQSIKKAIEREPADLMMESKSALYSVHTPAKVRTIITEPSDPTEKKGKDHILYFSSTAADTSAKSMHSPGLPPQCCPHTLLQLTSVKCPREYRQIRPPSLHTTTNKQVARNHRRF